MKTQVETFRHKQEQNNRIMMIVIVICGVLLFVATGFAGFDEEGRVNTTTTNYQAINSIEASVSSINNGVLEVDKLRQVILDRQNLIYRTVMNGLAEIEEPGMTFQDVASVGAFHEQYFNDNNDVSYTVSKNSYLDALYKQKNDEVFAAVENDHRFKDLLAEENENNLKVENWMVTNSAWSYVEESNNNFDEFLADMYEKKNREVFKAIEEAAYWRELLVAESEIELEPVKFDPHPEITVVRIDSENNISPSASGTGFTKNQYLLGLLAEKNEAVFKSIELQYKCKEFLAAVEEEPLEVEDWMVDERCWCPNKKQGEHLYTEPYAMKTK